MNRTRTWKLLSLCGLAGGTVYMVHGYGRKMFPSSVHLASISENKSLASSTGSTAGDGSLSTDPNTANMDLKLVQVFFRHGARTPLRHMPKLEEVHYDPRFLLHKLSYTDIPYVVKSLHGGPRPPSPMDKRYAQVTFKNGVAAGQLTALGQDQVYCLGRQLRRDYPTLIGEQFDANHVWIQSTNINRCIESLKCVLAGIYGEPSFRNKDPVVISVSPFKEETLHPNLRSCPTLRAMEKRVRERESEIPGLQSITDRINNILGLSGRQDLMSWRDHLAARKVHGLPVPKFLLDLEEDIEKGAINMLSAYMSGLPEDQPHSLRLTVGRAFHTVQSNMDQVINDPTNPLSLCLFSCHDSTLTPLLKGLDGFDGLWPPYAADLRFELWQDKQGQCWVKTKYIDEELCIGGLNKKLLTLAEFKEVLSPYVIDRKDYMTQCSLSQAFWDALDDEVDQEDESPVPENM